MKESASGEAVKAHHAPARCRVHAAAEVRPSGIEGHGLFVREPIALGTIVIRLGGRLLTGRELAVLLRDADRYVDCLAVDRDLHLVLEGNELAHYGNHSCDPNLWHVGPFTLAARRDIEKHEELTVDYATHTEGEWTMECRCGSSLCRGLITGNDWQRPDLLVRYGDHWTPALARLIDEHANEG
ncbi:MAG TPA: SET domain-containing protein-lysine N-methyltransferase [Chloroflexota bacterium]|nr:SET domain-containing protein-lysine N-methyltransferase [Chloroflexota bacterium]